MDPTLEDIRAFADRIGSLFPAQRVILFGSRARGTARPDSDIDLLVLLEHTGNDYGTALDILRRARPGFWAHVIVHDPKAAELRYRMGDPVIRDAFDRGQVLYERAA